MKNIAVVIRVFSRVEDTKCLVEIIKKKWSQNNYSIFVSFNGANSNYKLDSYVYENTNVLEVSNNSGHRSGARDLVQHAYKYIKENNDFDYILFIESDFWLLDENLILDAIKSNKELSTTIWIEARSSLAVDFFLIKKKALDAHVELLDWKDSPETDFRNAVRNAGLSVNIYKKLRSVHAPSSMRNAFKKYFRSSFYEGGRFRLFSKAKAVTHHIEDLDGGLEEKKFLANSVANEEIFENTGKRDLTFLEKNAPSISLYIPQGSWLRRKIWK